MITPAFKIKLSSFLRNILNSYGSQCICLFGSIYYIMHGKKLYIYNVFYQPGALKSKLSLKYIVQLNKILTKINVHSIIYNRFHKKNKIKQINK